jgi:glycosyltransferase involved in cell wall biosynthesis
MTSTLRVGFVSVPDASSESTWAGTPLNTLRALKNTPGVEVELISPLKTNLKLLYTPWKLQEKITRKHFIWYLEEPSLRYFARQVEPVFRDKKLDVIFATSSIPITLLRPDIPVVFWTDAVFHVMEDYYPGVFSNISERTRRAALKQEETALRRADFACYGSQWAANAAKRLTEPDRVQILPYGPNMQIEHTSEDVRNWIKARRQRGPHQCNLLLIGGDWERKGAPVAVEAARLLNTQGIRTTLRVIGCTPPTPQPPFVEILGYLRKSDPAEFSKLVEALRVSDIFILPSRAEAFGIVVSEAAAFGIPSLVCETGGLTDTVLPGTTGFALPLEDDGALFAEKAKVILSQYERFANNSYEDYRNRLNWPCAASRLTDLMRMAQEKHRRS